MKDEASFTLVGAVKKTFVVPSGKMAILTLETSVDGRRCNHELKCFKENIGYVQDLQVGEIVEITGAVGRMSSSDCEYAKIPGKQGRNEGQVYYPYIPSLNVQGIRRDPSMAGKKKSDADEDSIPD